MNNRNFDNCTPFHIHAGAFAGRFVRLDEVLQNVLGRHNYPENVSAALAETTALAVLLANALKYKGLFTLQIQGNGPVSVLVADVTSEGKVRACAKFDEEKLKSAKTLRKTDEVIEEVPHLVGGGYMAFTIDQGAETELYQGVVDLQGKTLTELALRYFKQSEQIDTVLKLFVKRPEGESKSWQSAGIILQKTPVKGGKNLAIDEDALAEAWNEAGIFMNSLSADEVFNADLSATDILQRLFHADNLVVAKAKAYEFGCRCSRDKLFSTLSGFGKQEIEEMAEEGKITATCSFCSEKYVFDKNDLLKH